MLQQTQTEYEIVTLEDGTRLHCLPKDHPDRNISIPLKDLGLALKGSGRLVYLDDDNQIFQSAIVKRGVLEQLLAQGE